MAIDPQDAAQARAYLDEHLEKKRQELAKRVERVLERGLRPIDMSPEAIDERLMQVFELLAVCESLGESEPL